MQGKFDPSATSLWGVLTKLGVCEFEGGRLEPVVAYTNNQVSTVLHVRGDDNTSTTL